MSLATTDWSQFTGRGENVSVNQDWAPGEEIMADPAWASRIETALRQRDAGHVRPIEDILEDVDADD